MYLCRHQSNRSEGTLAESGGTKIDWTFVHKNWYFTATNKGPRQLTATNLLQQRRLAEKGDPKCIFTIPRAILPKPSLNDKISDEITVTKSLLRGQLTWLVQIMRYFKNFVFMSAKKETHNASSVS